MSGLTLDVIVVILAGLALLSVLKILFDFAAKKLPPETARYFHFPNPLSLVVAGLLVIVSLLAVMLVPAYLSHAFPDCRFLRALQRPPLVDLGLYLSSSLTASWLIARFQKDM